MVTAIGRVVAPVGTVALSSVAETNVTLDELMPWNLTVELEVKPTPLIVTTVPAGPLAGVNDVIDRVGVNCVLLVAVPCPSVTEIVAGTAPLGTTAFSSVPDTSVTDGELRDPNLTVIPGT